MRKSVVYMTAPVLESDKSDEAQQEQVEDTSAE